MEKELLFSIRKEDFDWQFFRGSGNGGQKRQKTSSACRCIHRASGAVGESRDGRSQSHNRETAFLHCVESPEFQSWFRLHTAAVLQGYRSVEEKVEEQMREENLQFEYGVV